MKKFRLFLALFLAFWLLAVPALADSETGGDSGESSSVSDGIEDDSSSSPEEAPPEDPSSSETGPPEEDSSSAESPPPEETGPSDTETPPSGADPVDPAPETPEVPADPAPETPEVPVDPAPETPATPPISVPDISVEVPPSYIIPDTPLVPGALEVPVEAAPAEENHQVFTVTTIPEFARVAMNAYSGSTMASVVRDLFGTYTPKVQTVSTYVNGELISAEEQYVPGVAGMDWDWIAGVVVFLLMLYCLFRLLGGSVKYG